MMRLMPGEQWFLGNTEELVNFFEAWPSINNRKQFWPASLQWKPNSSVLKELNTTEPTWSMHMLLRETPAF